MRKNRKILLIFSLVIVSAGMLLSAPDFFGMPGENKTATSQKQLIKTTSSPYQLIGIVFSPTCKKDSYAIFLFDGRYTILKPGQGKRLKLVKVVNENTVLVKIGRREKMLTLKKKKKIIKKGGAL